jgi:quercetin dioxygenase-like cupin family protein
MRTIRLTESADYDPGRVVAIGLLAGEHSNLRMIRLGPGQTLPPHTHATSDPFVYAVEGQGELDTPDGVVTFEAGMLAQYADHEELRVANHAVAGLTLLAPVCPPEPSPSAT